jgi:nucleoside-diphosphate-sugar epimerase
MRVFIAGATGAVGRQLVPLLVADGHDIVAMVRTAAKVEDVRAMGAEPVLADALDPVAVGAAVAHARPEVVVHELTAIPAQIDPRRFAEEFEATNRLRRHGTRNLVAAAVAAGARRVVAQSIAQAYRPVGGWIKTEGDPLYGDAPPVFREIFDAVIELERIVLAAADLEGIVLRYGNFYGPGTRFADDGSDAELVRAERFPVAGGGTAVWSFVHVHDAATATALAISGGEPGIYNVVDDEPAAVADWLPVYARALGAPRPPVTGPPTSDYGVHGMLHSRGASNAKAKRDFPWTLRYPSWREGFAAGGSGDS